MKRFLSLNLCIILLIAFSINLSAQIEEIYIGVPGMTWGLWAYGVKKTLKRLAGVQDVEVRLEKQDAKIILKPGEPLDPRALREAVRKADFKPQKIRIKARGELTLTTQSARLALKMTDTGQLFLLVPSLSDKNQESQKNSPFVQLQETFKNGSKRVIVSGEAAGENEQPLKLLVEEYEIID